MEEHNFAYEILNGNIKNELVDAPTRDYIFHDVLSIFNEEPVSIFQIGGIESFDIRWRLGSGWSDTIFGEYIKKHGGKLTVVDISLNSLAHSVYAANKLGYEIDGVYGDAIDHIKPGYDIYYLDGSDDPQEAFDQFKKIEDQKCIILSDDFKIKGTFLKDYLNLNGIDYSVHEVANDVAVINLREG